LLGGFPCQDFSSCGPKSVFKGKRGLLYKVLEDYMKVHQPIIAVGENVPHLAKLAEGAYLDTIVRDFSSAGYDCIVWRLYCPDYGLPQNRTRLFFVCVRDDIFSIFGRPEAPLATHFMKHRTIDWALDDLVTITDETVPNQSQYFVATKATAGAGQGDQVSRRGEVAYAVRANPKARVHFHYELPRRLTVRECARLQAFPDEFIFPFSASTNIMQIGNAVPPIIGHAVATTIHSFLQRVNSRTVMTGAAEHASNEAHAVT
jgi:DNA (cytosine-5)-methyltransferase 1